MIKINLRSTILSLFTAGLLMTFSACKKSDDTKSRTEYLIQGNWKEIKYEQRVGTGAWVDLTGTPAACEADNYVKFSSNGTYESNEGATKCNPGDPQIIDTGTWSFLTNETQISITSTGSTPDVGDINQLDDNTFVITTSYVFGITTYYDRYTFSH
ncbi:MAG: lipocalin family protein [Chitinophagaceae bacterium]|nr:lipocalin family protein [Chitinophagaceae bacterium]